MIDNHTDGWNSATKLQLTPGGEPQKHVMNAEKPFGYKKLNDDGQEIELIIKHDVPLTHDEHGTIVLSEGKYTKTNQMEFDPFNNTVSYIFD
jgi:hypothetical protein